MKTKIKGPTRDVHEKFAKDLTADQRAALLAFAHENGHLWKSKLRIGWFNANAQIAGEVSPELQQIRNQLGPLWLNRVRLTRPTTSKE